MVFSEIVALEHWHFSAALFFPLVVQVDPSRQILGLPCLGSQVQEPAGGQLEQAQKQVHKANKSRQLCLFCDVLNPKHCKVPQSLTSSSYSIKTMGSN